MYKKGVTSLVKLLVMLAMSKGEWMNLLTKILCMKCY